MNAQFLSWLTRAIVSTVVLSTLWLAHATDKAERRPRMMATATASAAAAPAHIATKAATQKR